jgi:hypothetical protein
MMIVKVQQSLFTTEDNQQVLVYDERQSVLYQQEMTPELRGLLGSKPKIYCRAQLRADGKLVLGQVVRPRHW